MVGTSAMRSPRPRQRLTARRSADTVRTIRMAIGAEFVRLKRGGGELAKASVRGHVGPPPPVAAPRRRRALRGKADMATLTGGGLAASVPIAKFASLCRSLVCELRDRRTLATY